MPGHGETLRASRFGRDNRPVVRPEALVDRAPLPTLCRGRAGPRARPRRPGPRRHRPAARSLEGQRRQRRRAKPPLGDHQGAATRHRPVREDLRRVAGQAGSGRDRRAARGEPWRSAHRSGQPRADGRSPGRGRHRDLAGDAADRQHRGMGAARAADLHLDPHRTEPRQRRIEPVPAPGLCLGPVGRDLRRRHLADPAGDRPAHRRRRDRRAVEERLGGGIDPARKRRRAAGNLSDGDPALRRGLRPIHCAGAAAPRRAQRAAAEHAGRLRLDPGPRRRHGAARRERRRRARRAQRRHAATQPRARAGPAPARRAAAPPADGSVADRTQVAFRRQSPRAAPRRPGRQRQRADRSTGDRARHPAVRIAARRLAASRRLQAGDCAHADRRAARGARRQRGSRFVRPSGLAPARPDRRGQPRLFARRGSAPVELPLVRQRGRRRDGRRRGAGHDALSPRPQPDRRASLGAAAGPARCGPGLGRCAAALGAARDPAAAPRAAPHRPDGAGAHHARRSAASSPPPGPR